MIDLSPGEPVGNACFWDIQTSGQTTSDAGTGKTTAQMQTAKTFLDAGWDFMGETKNATESMWWIDEGRDYPRLWWQHGRALYLDPSGGAEDVSCLAILRWIAGGAEFSHDVYLGDEEAGVAAATTETQGTYRGRQAAGVTTYNPGILERSKTYYWRVDEVNPNDPTAAPKGNVWRFTTADHVIMAVVDDFETYTDDWKAGQAVFQTWVDGLGPEPNVPGNGTASFVGYLTAPFAEQVIVHGGKQSMPMGYDNRREPWYSEAERTWTTPQDWTIEGADTLTLYFRGEATNGRNPLYVGIEDSAGRIAVVIHPDAEAVLATEWQKWHIALADVRTAGVDVAAVKEMVIGVGDRQNPKPGGTGTIYIDDIRLTKRMP